MENNNHPDLAKRIDSVRAWSDLTFGPGPRVAGVLDHLRKELKEVEKEPTDLYEWVDIMILAVDGATRAGFSGAQVIEALYAKWDKNEKRVWPDWRTVPEGMAIEHDRSYDEPVIVEGKTPFDMCICIKCGPPWRKNQEDTQHKQGQFMGSWMALCPACGNKRCPAAIDHTEACSGSNDPDQEHLKPIEWEDLPPEIRDIRIKFGLFSEDTPPEIVQEFKSRKS